jgi:hypothetical protein
MEFCFTVMIQQKGRMRERGEREQTKKRLPLSDRVRERFGWGDSFSGWAGPKVGS